MRKKLVKGLAKGLLVLMCATSVMAPTTKAEAREKTFDISYTCGMNSISFTWPKTANAEYYNIYRAKMNTKKGEPGKYVKIAKVSKSEAGKYTDKKVKAAVDYAYKVKGFVKKNGKETLVCGTYGDWWSDAVAGMFTPKTRNGGITALYDAENDGKKVYLNVYYGSATYMKIDGYKIYRKAPDQKKYSLVKTLKTEDGGAKYCDKNVETGKTYKYKVKGYKKVNGKTVYSKFSNVTKITAENTVGQYKVKYLSKEGEVKGTFKVKISSDAANRDTVITKKGYVCCRYNKKNYGGDTEAIKYSYDNKTWEDFSEDKLILKGGETIYVEFKYTPDKKDGGAFIYTKNTKYSYLYTMNYKCPGKYKSNAGNLNLKEETGSLCYDED